METEGLRQALDKYGFDAAFAGARRDEDITHARERIFSFRSAGHRWEPTDQRPELWKLYNARTRPGESIRAFPLANWTELDIWQYIYRKQIPVVPLYYAAERPVVRREGRLILVDDERMPLDVGEVPMKMKVRFPSLGCYPLTEAIESEAETLPALLQELLLARTPESPEPRIDGGVERKREDGC